MFDLIVPECVLVELERVLTRKLGFSDERWLDVRELIERVSVERPAPLGEIERVTGDPDDDLVLACAVGAQADLLVSGDRQHLVPLGEHRGVQILTPQALLANLV